jgi:hypothetical protein
MALMATHPINDYYVVTSQRSARPDRWSWEIRRKSKLLGIKMTEDGFQSDAAGPVPNRADLPAFCDIITERLKRLYDV